MTLIKTSLLNGIAVVIKMLTLLGLNKILAIYVGPSGYAALGQFQNAVQVISVLGSTAINTGVTKYTAENFDDEIKQRAVWRTAGTVALYCSIVVGAIVFALRGELAELFLHDRAMSGVFGWFAATLTFFVFNALLLAILNGKKEVGRYVIANIAGSLLSFGVVALMAVTLGIYGALVALAIYQALGFIVTFFVVCSAKWFKLSYLIGSIDKAVLKDLGKYALMAVVTAACVPVSHLMVRSYIGITIGWESAGYWEAMWRLSAAYLMFASTVLGVYYLPRLSEIRDNSELRREIVYGYKVLLPITIFCSALVYIFRHQLVILLFSSDFSEMAALFGWQMIGDSLKIGSWILAYLMLSKAMVKLYIATEIAFAVLFYLLTMWLVNSNGLVGVAQAHALNYFIYWIFLLRYVYPIKGKML